MREGWKIELLKNVCKVFTDGNWIESKDQSPEGIRLVQTGNIGFGYFRNKGDKSRFISEETFERLKCTEILPGDLLVSRLPYPVGKSCIIPDIDTKMITGVDCTIIRPKDYLISEYLGYFQMSDEYLKDVQSRVSGTTRSRISRKNLGLIQIPIPPLQEQQQIVAILDQAFETIDQAKANIEKNIANAKELFQSKLNDIFSQKGDGWEEKKLVDVITLKSGTTLSKSLEKSKGKIPYLKVSDMNIVGNEFEITTSTKFVEKEDIKNSYLLPKGTIIFPKRGGAIATNKKRITTLPICVDLNTMGAIPGSLIYSEYLHFYFRSFDLMDIASGTTIPQINNYSFESLTISIPTDKSIQYKIVENLENYRISLKEVEIFYNKKLFNLEDLKKSILQKAFAGELTNKEVAV